MQIRSIAVALTLVCVRGLRSTATRARARRH